ncbi:MAG: ribokinase [Thermoleophilia bacterium]
MGIVAVVGSINVDEVVRVDRLPREGETVSGGTYQRFGGGKGANQAVGAARAGATVRMVGCVGRDAIGDGAIDELRAAGVEVTHVARSDEASTGLALIVVDADGRNQIAVAPGANRLITMDPAAVTGDAGVVLLSFEAPDEALCAAADAASAGGWTIVVNPAPTRPIPQRLLAAQPILIPNEHEVADLTGIPDPERAARVLQAMTGAPVIVTLGAAGALLLEGDTATTIPAPEVDVADTTGAGDCLCGTLAARLAAGDALSLAVERAVAAASLSTTTPGAR